VKSEAATATKKYDGIQKDLDDWISKANDLEQQLNDQYVKVNQVEYNKGEELKEIET